MFKPRKLNPKAPSEINTGFGVNSSNYGGRFLNKDGKPNIEKRGVGYFEKISWYHALLEMRRSKFIAAIFIFYLAINILFAFLYVLAGVNHLEGITAKTHFGKFLEAFYFSCQTFTTVGYGKISPLGFAANSLSALEGLIGWASFAVVTGLIYGRFSRPKAYIRFSENAILAPYQNGKAIMLRLAPFKNTTLTDAEAKVTLGLIVEEDGKMINKFFPLKLEYEKVNSLTLSWTIVHPITETSPFYNFSEDDFKNAKGEIMVFVKAFDDMFSNVVVARTSYLLDEVIPRRKFNPMYQRSPDQSKTLLHLDKLSSISEAEINF
ncbi:MAG TPA: ion channel [Hanamia sp.]|nr:ion channel [Hanamia sp.]